MFTYHVQKGSHSSSSENNNNDVKKQKQEEIVLPPTHTYTPGAKKMQIPNTKNIQYIDSSTSSTNESTKIIQKPNVLNEKNKKPKEDDFEDFTKEPTKEPELPDVPKDKKGDPSAKEDDVKNNDIGGEVGGDDQTQQQDISQDGDFGDAENSDDFGDDGMGTDGEFGEQSEEDKEKETQDRFDKYHYFRVFDELRNNIELFNIKFLTYETSPELEEKSKREVYIYIKNRIEKIKNDISFVLQYRIKTIDLDLLSKAYINTKQQLIILFELFFNIFKDTKTQEVASKFKLFKKQSKK